MAPKKAEALQLEPIYFKFHLRLLLYLGIDIIPVENPTLRALFHVYAIIIIGLTWTFAMGEFFDLVWNFEGIEKMTFNLCYFVTHVLGTVKMILILATRQTLWHHFQALENGIFKPNFDRGGVREFQLVKDAIRLCTRQGYVFYSLVIVIISGRAIFAATSNWSHDKNSYFDGNVTVNAKVMPYTTWMPFDYNVSPYYELVFVFQIFSTVVYGFYIGASDAVICGFLILIKAQFLMIKNNLDILIRKAEVEAELQPSDINIIELLNENAQKCAAKLTRDCVVHHTELIAFCNQAEDTFTYLMLLQFLSSLLIVCFQLFQLSTLTPGSVEFFSMLNYFILMLFQLLCYCWHGNEVQLVSGSISSYIYEINWPILDESIKKSLLLMMMRSQRPCYFTAGKFSLLSLQTFMTIVRGGSSYFMFLRQMNS